MITPEQMRRLQWANSLTLEEVNMAHQFLSDMGWNDKRDYIPDWLAYMAQLMVSQGWSKRGT